MASILRLKGTVQHYAWGGTDFIPHLLNLENRTGEPFAEYWLGAHDNAPSQVCLPQGESIPLNQLIRRDPPRYLGEATARRFGRLPYLFKILDVHDMLSIQVHPTKEEAEKGFALENAAGIPLQAPERNYKDDNHKPEVMVALSEFWLLHGFLPADRLRQTLVAVPELNELLPVFENGGYRSLYRYVMELPQEQVNRMLHPLLKRLIPLYEQGKLQKTEPDFWAARAACSGITGQGNTDRGIFSIYFFNIVQAQPGEAVFQAAGIPHAYLEGRNMELMANSDNVLRGGLTPKHVDVTELLKHIRFEGITPQLLEGESADTFEKLYPCPVPDFVIGKIAIDRAAKYANRAFSLEILITLEGSAALKAGGDTLSLERGEAALVTSGTGYTLTTEGEAVVFKASCPGPAVPAGNIEY